MLHEREGFAGERNEGQRIMEQTAHMAQVVGNVVVLLLLASAILALSRKTRLPFSVALVLCGILLGQLADVLPAPLSVLGHVEVSLALILFVFLPTLIFESTFNMDSRLLRHNLGEVMTLAVPGLLLSTLLIGGIVAMATPIPSPRPCCSAPFSAPPTRWPWLPYSSSSAPSQRLTVLVEGESLFNDATSIVAAKILVGVVLAGTVSAGTVLGGLIDFILLFAGGLLVGWLLGLVESDPAMEISLTTVAAYLAFLLAEEVFRVSGVMATVAAGLTLGGWGRMKISASVRTALEHFWDYLAFVANALIFLLVGLRLDLALRCGATSGRFSGCYWPCSRPGPCSSTA